MWPTCTGDLEDLDLEDPPLLSGDGSYVKWTVSSEKPRRLFVTRLQPLTEEQKYFSLTLKLGSYTHSSRTWQQLSMTIHDLKNIQFMHEI